MREGVMLAEQSLTPLDMLIQKRQALAAAFAAERIGAEQLAKAHEMANAAMVNSYARATSAIGNALTNLFNENKAVTAALKNPPGPPFSYAYAAAALANSMAQVANIRKTTKSGGGSGSAADGAGSGGTGGSQAQTGVQQSLVVQGISADQIFSGDAVRGLAQQLLDYQRDGGKVILA